MLKWKKAKFCFLYIYLKIFDLKLFFAVLILYFISAMHFFVYYLIFAYFLIISVFLLDIFMNFLYNVFDESKK